MESDDKDLLNRKLVEKEINSLRNRRVLRKYYHKIHVPRKGFFQIDLLDMSNISSKNKGFTFILNIVDIYSRKAWAYPLKTKRASVVLEAIKDWWKQVRESAVFVQSDNGSEFAEARPWLEKQGVKYKMVQVGDHNSQAIVESFNRTLRMMFRKIFVVNGNMKWHEYLQGTIDYYNNDRIHSSIKAKPEDVWVGKTKPFVEAERFVDDLKVGDVVRIAVRREIFDKSTAIPMYSKKTYRVVERVGNRYRLEGREDLFARYDLKKSMTPEQPSREKPVDRQLKEVKRDRRVKRTLDAEGIDQRNILRLPRRGRREKN